MSENRRPTNIKRAARELQAQNPGMSYTEARAKVVAAAATDTTPTSTDSPVTAPFDGLITWTTVAISASHVSEAEWNRLIAAPMTTWAFRSMPDPDGNDRVNAVMVRCYDEDINEEIARPTGVTEEFPTLLRVLKWGAANGAGWLYLDVDADVVDALTEQTEESFLDADPNTVTESEAQTLLSVYRSQFGWAGTYFTRADAEVRGPLTDEQWATVQDSYYWRKGLSERLTEAGWSPIMDAVNDVLGATVEDEAAETTPLSAEENAAMTAWHTFQSRFGWAGSMFMRGDAETAAQRPLTDEEWEAVQDNYYWNRAVADLMAEAGNELVENALDEAGITGDDEDDYED